MDAGVLIPSMLLANGLPASPFAGRREDRVAHGRGDRRRSRFADSAGRFLGRDDMYFNDGHLIHSHLEHNFRST
jgi:hypothetical protein